MMRPIATKIDPALCTGCGECVRVCPSRSLSMADGIAAVTGRWSLGCGHCAAVCPAGAVTVGFVDGDALRFATLDTPPSFRPPGEGAGELLGLMMSRRSCRNYRDRPVPAPLIEDLVRAGTTAPSGTTSQLWTFTVLPDRRSVTAFGGAVAGFFRSLNRKASNGALRLLARLFRGDLLGRYYREHYEAVAEALRLYDEEGRDLLFHGAPAVIFIGSRPGGSCPSEDALMAAQNILLAAHAMGLGTCMIGFAVDAVRHDPSLARTLELDRHETIHAAIALGYPDERYLRPAGRRAVTPRVVRPEEGRNDS